MKFTQAWANIAKENMNLKAALFITSACVLFLGFSTVRLSLREPLIIERGCFSKNIQAASTKPTLLEMDTFIKESLRQRFNSEARIIEGYLSVDEQRNKEKEQLNLAKKDITQILIVRNIDYVSGEILVEADRLYSVQNVRSSFPVKFKLKLETKARTQTNPYGLILTNTQEAKERSKDAGN